MSEQMKGLLLPLLATLFGPVTGNVEFFTDSEALSSRDPDEIEAFLAAALGQVNVDLVTTDDLAAAYTYHLALDVAEAHVEAHGAPVLALTNKTHAVLVYSMEPAKDAAAHFEEAGQAAGIGSIVPLPGRGWEFTQDTIEKLTALAAEWAEPEEVEEESSAEPGEVEEESSADRYKDAEIIGGMFPDELLDRKVEFMTGANAQDKRWPSKTTTVRNLLEGLATHAVGEKDGRAITQGASKKGERKARAMTEMYLLAFDVDSGFSIDWAIKRAQESNLACVVYTTHSHMKPQTLVLQSSFASWARKNAVPVIPAAESMRDFLINARKWEPEIAATVTVEEAAVHEVDGAYWVVNHTPMPKFRMFFFLRAPYNFLKQPGLLHDDAIIRWRKRYIGASKMLGIPVDRSCTDPSRLFYTPRHGDGKPFRIVWINGNPLNFDNVLEVDEEEEIEQNVFLEAAKALGSDTDTNYNGFDLKRWIAKCGKDYMLVDALRESLDGKHVIRNDAGTDKIELQCPFDELHSNAGDSEDRACFAINAHEQDSDRGFQFGCRHNSCSGFDRLDFIHKSLRLGWISTEQLSDQRFIVTEVGEDRPNFRDPVVVMNEITSWIDSAETPVPDSEVDYHVEMAIEHLRRDQWEAICQAMVDHKLVAHKVMKEKLKHFSRQQKLKSSTKADSLKQRIIKQGIELPPGCKPVLLAGAHGFAEQKQQVIEVLNTINDPATGNKVRLFDYGGEKYDVEIVERLNDVRMRALDKDVLSNILDPRIRHFREGEDGLSSVGIQERVLREVAISNAWYCPPLMRFASMPYFDQAGNIVTSDGYNPVSQVFLKSSVSKTFSVPAKPSQEDIEKAKDLLLNKVYGEFPFDDGPDTTSKGQCSKAHFLALLLQPFIREMIAGQTPIYMVNKPTPGTGASLLIETALIINSGKLAPESATEKKAEEEQRKEITSVFRAGKSFYWIDNINETLRSAAYCNLATAATWEDRMLGKSEMVKFPNQLQFIISGNALRGTYEIMRRALPIRLDAKANPLERTFKITNLKEYVKVHREELTAAVMTLVKAWLVAGKPDYEGRLLASFEDWSRVTGGILQHAGIDGFLGNLHLSMKHADDETRNWEQFVNELVSKFGLNSEFTSLLAAQHFGDDGVDFPDIGVPPVGEPKQWANRLRQKIEGKLGVIYTVTAQNAETKEDREVQVTLKRHKDAKNKITFSVTDYLG